VGKRNEGMAYRFVSDYPFSGREPHKLDDFEQNALATLRMDPGAKSPRWRGSIFDRSVRMATP